MLKLLPHFTSLGVHLKRTRKDRRLTQSDLAQQAHITIPTIRLLENGQGTLTSFWSVLEALHVEIAGRNLPAGESIGVQIPTLRKRKGMSQRALASIIETTQPTLIALERHCTGRLYTLESIGKIKPLFTRAHPPAPPRTSPVSPLGALPSRPRTPAAGESSVDRQAGRASSAPHATQSGEGAGHQTSGLSIARRRLGQTSGTIATLWHTQRRFNAEG
jgi:transcriptional regulator with XRE-family HTH domain